MDLLRALNCLPLLRRHRLDDQIQTLSKAPTSIHLVPRSEQCVFYVTLSPQDTGYIDKLQLQKALNRVYCGGEEGVLDFGIRTRNERWTFWAPTDIEARHIRDVLARK